MQLQILTAIVKLFLTKPTDTQDLVQQVLSISTQETDNPDLRDRGLYEILSIDYVVQVCLKKKLLIILHAYSCITLVGKGNYWCTNSMLNLFGFLHSHMHKNI